MLTQLWVWNPDESAKYAGVVCIDGVEPDKMIDAPAVSPLFQLELSIWYKPRLFGRLLQYQLYLFLPEDHDVQKGFDAPSVLMRCSSVGVRWIDVPVFFTEEEAQPAKARFTPWFVYEKVLLSKTKEAK
jgi:hypothetical protein